MKIYAFILTISLVGISSVAVAQTCNSNVTRVVPDSRYELLLDGSEVRDKRTGLIWQRCSLGQTWVKISNTDEYTCSGNANNYIWAEALKAAKEIDNGYRLPNIKELQSLVEEACEANALNEKIFPNTVGANYYYWSSSSNARNGNLAWSVRFYDGYSGNDSKMNKNYVRLVRGGR